MVLKPLFTENRFKLKTIAQLTPQTSPLHPVGFVGAPPPLYISNNTCQVRCPVPIV